MLGIRLKTLSRILTGGIVINAILNVSAIDGEIG